MSGTVPTGARRLRFGLHDLDLDSGELRRSGVLLRLQDQPFHVLEMLVARPGELVTREAIQQRLWPDTIVEFESNLNAVVKRLREVLGDSATTPRFIETVPRRGYRFIAAVQADPADALSHPPAPDPSIAVLPFRDRSPGQDQEYFCDGLTEELTDALTKVEDLRVVSRISAFQYKDTVDDVRKIGAELNVGTLLEGSLRRADNRLRINTHLTSVRDGCHTWSESYECDVRDLFDVQDEITAAIMNTLTSELGWKLARTSGPRMILSKPTLTRDLDAHDLYLKGLFLAKGPDAEAVQKSIDCFEAAIERDPEYAMAYAALADSHMGLASLEDDADRRAELYATAREELETYLGMIERNYRGKTAG